MRNDVKIREKISCPFCEEIFYGQKLATHLKYSHPKEKDSEAYKQSIESVQPGFVCSICGKTFQNDWWLDKHHAEYHDFHINSLPCGVCGKHLKNQSSLNTHMKKVHEKSRQVLCGVCGKLCLNKSQLNRHTGSQHSTEKFPCMECGKVFSSREIMRKHFGRTHEAKQHKCQTCEKAFRLPGDLRKHISQVHDKLKPFYCEVCQFRTATLSNLNIHRKKSHARQSISKIVLIEMVESGQHPFYSLSDIPMIRIGPY